MIYRHSWVPWMCALLAVFVQPELSSWQWHRRTIEWSSVAARVKPSVVPLRVWTTARTPAQFVQICTAVVIGQKRLMVESHCLHDPGPYEADRVPVTSIAAEYDVTILESTGRQSSWKAIEPRQALARMGEPIAAMGYAFGGGLIITTGTVSAHDDRDLDLVVRQQYGYQGAWPIMYFDVTELGGMSGGPIVDRDGKLVSLVRATIPDQPGSPDGLALGIAQMALSRLVLAQRQ